MTERSMRGHLLVIGATVYCPQARRRVLLDENYRSGDAFVCPWCGVTVPAKNEKENSQ